MRRLLFVLFVFFPILVSSQEKLSFDKVINVEGVDKQSLYVGVKEWFGLTFKSAKSVIEVDDKDAALIIGNSNVDYGRSNIMYACYTGWLKFTIKIQCRDGRFRVELTNFVHEVKKGNSSGCELGMLTTAEEYGRGGLQKGYNNKVWKDLKEKAEDIANIYFARLEDVNFKNINDTNSGDW